MAESGMGDERKNSERVLMGLIAVLALGLVLVGIFLWRTRLELKELNEHKSTSFLPTQPAVQSWPLPQASRGVPDPFQDDWGFASWDPFEEMEELQSRINRMFRESFGRARMNPVRGQEIGAAGFFEPDVDVKETPSGYVIHIDLPGMDKDKINVEVRGSTLTISGERKSEVENANKDGFSSVERSYGSFSRGIPLPEDASTEQVKAEYRSGVLVVEIPKLASEDTRRKSSKVTIA